MKEKILTLSIIHEPPRILLAMKKRGFGAGRWNGYGGKVEKGETIEDAAKRETFEEVGIEVQSIEQAGTILFEFQGNPELLEVHIFWIMKYTGAPTETEEMRPQWFVTDAIPYDHMWPSDTLWLPLFLEGKKFHGKVLFKGLDTVVEHAIEAE